MWSVARPSQASSGLVPWPGPGDHHKTWSSESCTVRMFNSCLPLPPAGVCGLSSLCGRRGQHCGLLYTARYVRAPSLPTSRVEKNRSTNQSPVLLTGGDHYRKVYLWLHTGWSLSHGDCHAGEQSEHTSRMHLHFWPSLISQMYDITVDSFVILVGHGMTLQISRGGLDVWHKMLTRTTQVRLSYKRFKNKNGF